MNNIQKVFMLFLLSVALCGVANAATYYVATTGNDSASGNITNPWKTFNKAWTGSGSGDTLLFFNGTYQVNETSALDYFYVDTPKTFRAITPRGVLFYINDTDQDGTITYFFYINANQFTIDGINLTGTKGFNTTRVATTISIRETADNIVINNTYFINQSSAGYSLYATASSTNHIDNITITGNTFYPNGTSINFQGLDQENVYVDNNSFIGAENSFNRAIYGALGLQYRNVTNWTISNNTVTGTNYFFSNITFIEIYNQNSTNGLKGLKIVNNVFGSSTLPLFGNFLFTTNMTNMFINNNTGYPNATNVGTNTYGINAGANCSGAIITNNMFGSPALYTSMSGSAINVNGANILIENNYVYANINTSSGIYVASHAAVGNASNVTIRNNNIYSVDSWLSYGIGLGDEGQTNYSIINSLMENNYYSGGYNITGKTHGMFLGYTKNSTVYNNVVNRSYYGFVIKGNDNAIVTNNTIIDNYYLGLYDKGSKNTTFTGNSVTSGVNTTYNLLITWNDADNKTSSGGRWFDNTVTAGTINIQDNSSVNMTNLSGNYILTIAMNATLYMNERYAVQALNDAGNVLSSINITVYNRSSGTLVTSKSTDSVGKTEFILPDSYRNSTTITYYQNYIVNATYNGKTVQYAYNTTSQRSMLQEFVFTIGIGQTGCLTSQILTPLAMIGLLIFLSTFAYVALRSSNNYALIGILLTTIILFFFLAQLATTLSTYVCNM